MELTGEPFLSRDVLDNLMEGCQVIGFDYTYLYVNDAVVAQGRLPRHQLLGRTMAACYPGIEATVMFAMLRRCMTERVPAKLENEFVFGDGSRTVFELRFVPVPEGLCILSLDVTERRHRLAAIVLDSEDAIVGRTLDGVITSWNRGAERMFGYTAAEMVGQRYERLFPPGVAVPDASRTASLAAGERIPSFETVRQHKDGTPIDVSVTLSPYRDLAGNVIGVSLIARDITALKRIQRELVAAKEAADAARAATEAANRELEAFAYSVAHDLRAPLRHIEGFSRALTEDCADQLAPEPQRYLARIRASTELMARLIDDLLNLSRVTRQSVARTSVDLSGLARAAHARLQLGEPARRIAVVIEDGVSAHADERLVAVVLDNLLGNAWKFTARRSDARIEVGAMRRDGVACYYVRDNGVGFDMAHAEKLFLPFHRLHPASEFDGTGIGLATVQRIVHHHGGRVWTEAKVGEGATFYFTLDAPVPTAGRSGG